MYATINDYNPGSCATIRRYSVEISPSRDGVNPAPFTRKTDALRFAHSVPDLDDVSVCEIVVCKFAYIVFHSAGAKEFSNKRAALRFARSLRKENHDDDVSVGFYDVTVENDIVCLKEV